MELAPEELTRITNRLRRAQGQLGGVIRMLENGRECTEVVTQLAAVSKAVDRAGFAVIASGIRSCIDGEGTADAKALNAQKLEKLFLSLA